MKLFLKITILVFFITNFASNSSSSIFGPIFNSNEEIDSNDFFNFNTSKYKYSEFKKILGGPIITQNDEKGGLRRDVKEYKKIITKFKSYNAMLSLERLNNGKIMLALQINDTKCDNYKYFIPNKYINDLFINDYTQDYGFAKTRFVRLSHDLNNDNRISLSCVELLSNNKESKMSTMIFFIHPKDSFFSKVVPFTKLRCNIEYYLDRSSYNENFQNLKNYQKKRSDGINYYILDETDKRLLDSNYLEIGKTTSFDDLVISATKRRKFDKDRINEDQTLIQFVKIDRISGKYLNSKTIFVGKNKEIAHVFKNRTMKADYVGSCTKVNNFKRKF